MKKKIKKYDIKGLRKKLKWSQADSAEKFGVSVRTWQRIEDNGCSLADFVKFVESIGSFVTQSPIEVFKVGGEVFNSKNFEI